MMAQSQSENVRLGEDGESVVLLDQTQMCIRDRPSPSER